MNIVVEHSENNLCPFIISISKVLNAIGHKIIFWNQNHKSIYEMLEELKPDIIIVNNSLKPNYWEIIKNKKYIFYGNHDPINKAIAKITKTNLIDLISYPYTFENHIFNTDILFSSNYYQKERDLSRLMDKVFEKTDLRIKYCGHSHIQSPYFAGFLETEEFTKIALCSKIVITTDEIEKISLLNRKIYAILSNELDIEEIDEICKNEKIRKSKLKEERKKIIDNTNSIEYVANLLENIGLISDKERSLSLIGNLS